MRNYGLVMRKKREPFKAAVTENRLYELNMKENDT